MSFEGTLVLSLAMTTLVVLVTTRIPPYIVMMGVVTLLSVTGVLSAEEALGGFSNSGLLTVAAMFVVAAGVHSSGGVDLLVNKVLGHPTTVRGAILVVFAPVLLLSAVLNNTPVVATMIPAIHVWSRKIGIPASKLMIPLSYSAILGGTLTLIGTSTNLVVNGQYEALTGNPGFDFFAITKFGAPVAILGGAFMVLVFPRLLPDRSEEQVFGNLREFTLEVRVDPRGPLVGKSIQAAGLRNLRRVYLVEIVREETVLSAVSPDVQLQQGDRLVFAGDTEAIADLLRMKGIVPSSAEGSDTLTSGRAERRLVEAVVSPHCAAIGRAIRDSRFRDRYGAVVLAVARHGERVKGNLGTIRLMAGDTLLLEARPAFVSRQKFNRDFLLVNDTESHPPRHERALLSWAVLVGIVLAAALGLVSMLNASLVGAGLMLLLGCCTPNQAERSLDLTVLITIAASFALGAALEKTGVAGFLAHLLIDLGGGRSWLLLALIYFSVSVLTEVITNNAAAILVLPTALSLCDRANLPHEPFVFAVMMAASASFATPLGYQTNLMVYGPGGYHFKDFLKVGVPMNLLVGIVTITNLIWFGGL